MKQYTLYDARSVIKGLTTGKDEGRGFLHWQSSFDLCFTKSGINTYVNNK